MKAQPAFAVTAPDFAFELDQLVNIRISDE